MGAMHIRLLAIDEARGLTPEPARRLNSHTYDVAASRRAPHPAGIHAQ
jgi:hypothetical protein